MNSLFDTHCHLNSKRLNKNLKDILHQSNENNVKFFLVPGLDYKTSLLAQEISNNYPNVYVACGLHPEYVTEDYQTQIEQPSEILHLDKVVAVGEIGIDNPEGNFNNDQMERQIEALRIQILLAKMFNKSIIIHSRNTTSELLQVLISTWSKELEGRIVFHCCEPDDRLLEFAINHKIYIGVDGDITYNQEKQEFIKKVPLDLLVLETDSPYLLPEPLKTQKLYPNTPANLLLISEYICNILAISHDELAEFTTNNAFQLFNLSK